jgi:peroxiredoxin Q/BCP
MKSLLLQIVLGCVFCGLAAGIAAAQQGGTVPKAGDAAPAFRGKDQDGKDWNLESLSGKKIILLYFYPKDDTPGCTKEACGFRDRMSELSEQGVQVLGVSFDSAASHKRFVEKYSLNFPLLADEDGQIADAYRVRASGKNVARRVSFLIGKDGKIAHVTDSPSAEVHLKETREALGKLASR